MRIDVWSDIACPWCYIGKRRLESALDGFEHASEVEVVWHSFQLDPGAPVPPTETSTSVLTRKYGTADAVAAMQANVTDMAAGEGLDFHLQDTLHLNTGDGHRLLHLALEAGGRTLQGQLKEALLDAYFVKALDVADHAVLRAITEEVGLDLAAVDRVLAGQEYADAVAADVRAAQAYGAGGVPFFVIDEKYGISGAQQVGMFAAALRQAWDERHPQLQTLGSAGGSSAEPGPGEAGSCGPEGCSV